MFDDQKREISDHGVWIRKVLAALEAALKLRGASVPSIKVVKNDNLVSSESDGDAKSYRSDDDGFSSQLDGYDSHSRRELSTTAGRRGLRSSSHSTDTAKRRDSSSRRSSEHRFGRTQSLDLDASLDRLDRRARASATSVSVERLERRRYSSKPTVAVSSSLDDFDFIQYSSMPQQRDEFLSSETRLPQDAVQPANIRFPGRKRPMERSDPRWNWFKIGQLKEQSRRQQSSSERATSHTFTHTQLAPSRHAIHSQRPQKRKLQAQLIGQVQSARLELRDKRSHSSRAVVSGAGGVATARARGYGVGYEPPPQRVFEAVDRREMTSHSTSWPRPEKRSTAPLSSDANSYDFAPGKPLVMPSEPWTSATASGRPETRIQWTDMYDILSDTISDDDALPRLSPSTRQFLITCGLVECSCGRHTVAQSNADALTTADWDDTTDDDDTFMRVRSLAASLRQSLTALRFHESEVMKSLSGSTGGQSVATASTSVTDDDKPYASLHEWRALVAAAGRYHELLARFVRYTVGSVRACLQLRACAALELVHTVIAEVSSTLAQLPDCEALFESCRSYVFFFEVADRSAKSTPLLTAITQAYWYSIQVLLALKNIGADGGVETVALSLVVVRAAQDAAESLLPVNRAILAASLFLVDLYLYLPSAYRIEPSSSRSGADASAAQDLPDETPRPALSLWLLLYECFSSGTCSFQDGKRSVAGDGRDFWAFLQAMVRTVSDTVSMCDRSFPPSYDRVCCVRRTLH